MEPTGDSLQVPAHPKRVATALAAVAAFLGIIVVAVGPSDTESISLGVNREPVTGVEEPEPAADEASDETPAPRNRRGQAPGDEVTVVTVPVAVAGNANASAPQPVPVPAPPPPPRTANGPAAPDIGEFFAEDDSPSVGETVRFRWWAGDADGLIRGVQIEFGDGTENIEIFPDRCVEDPSDPMAERPPAEHEYDEPGRYEVRLTVKSSGACGNGPTQTAVATITIDVGVVGVGPTSDATFDLTD